MTSFKKKKKQTHSESERKKKTFEKITLLIVFQSEKLESYWKGEHSMKESERKKKTWIQLCYGTVRVLERCKEERTGIAFPKSLEGSAVDTIHCHIRVAFSKVSAIWCKDFLLGWTCKSSSCWLAIWNYIIKKHQDAVKKCCTAICCMRCWENLSASCLKFYACWGNGHYFKLSLKKDVGFSQQCHLIWSPRFPMKSRIE